MKSKKKTFFIFISLICLLSSCQNKELAKYTQLSKEDYNNEYTYLNDEEHVFVSLDYNGIIDMLDNKESFVLYIGGAWCPNCQAAVPFINGIAKEIGIEIIYNFDTRIAKEKLKEDDIRNCNNKAQTKLYRKLIEALGYENPEGIVTENTDIARLSVPTVLVIKEGIMLDFLTREYNYVQLTNDITDINGNIVTESYKNELRNLFNIYY